MSVLHQQAATSTNRGCADDARVQIEISQDELLGRYWLRETVQWRIDKKQSQS